MMWPGSHELMYTTIHHLKNCPIWKANIQAAEDIFGPNLGALKGKTVHQPETHVQSHIHGIPPDIMNVHHDFTLTVDIMFVNAIPFLLTNSCNLKFGTVEVLLNQQVLTIKQRLASVVSLYQHWGFRLTTILANREFEPLHPSFPMLNICGAAAHIPNIEWYIRTVKDRA